MRKKQIKIGAVLSYIQIILSIVINIIYTPIMLRYLGKSEYGLYNSVASAISMMSVMSLGFGAAYIRYYSRYKKKDDKEAVSKLNGLMMIIFSIIGLIALFCGIYLSFNLSIVFKDGLTEAEYKIAKILMLILTVNLSLSFPGIVFTQIISAHERFIFLKLLTVIKTLASPLITLPLLVMGYKSIAVVAVTASVSFVIDCVFLYYVLIKLKCKFIFHDFEKNILREIFGYTVFIAINQIVDRLNWYVDKVLLGRFCGTLVVATYSIGSTLHNCFQHFSTSLNTLFTPRVHKLVNDIPEGQRRPAFTELFIKVGRIQFAILALLSSGLVFFGQSFIVLWAGNEYSDSYYVSLLLILPTLIPLIENMGIEIQRAQNRHKFRSLVYLIIAVVNVITTSILAPIFGAMGAAACTAGAVIIGEWIIINIYYYKYCEINVLRFFMSIMKMSLGLLIPITVGLFISRFGIMNNFISLGFCILIYSLCYLISMYFIGFNNEEKKMVLAASKKIVHFRRNE